MLLDAALYTAIATCLPAALATLQPVPSTSIIHSYIFQKATTFNTSPSKSLPLFGAPFSWPATSTCCSPFASCVRSSPPLRAIASCARMHYPGHHPLSGTSTYVDPLVPCPIRTPPPPISTRITHHIACYLDPDLLASRVPQRLRGRCSCSKPRVARVRIVFSLSLSLSL